MKVAEIEPAWTAQVHDTTGYVSVIDVAMSGLRTEASSLVQPVYNVYLLP